MSQARLWIARLARRSSAMENRPANTAVGAGHARPAPDTAGASDETLARACDIVNRDEDIAAMEREFDAISRDVAEPWNIAPPDQPLE